MEIRTKKGVKLSLRPLVAGDEKALRQFHHALSAESRRKFLPHLYDDETIGKFIERNDNGKDLIFVAAAPGGRIVAYFFLWEFETSVPVLGIGICDEFHGAGVGRQLMQVLIDRAASAGKDGIDLTTLPDNDRAYGLYSSVGFEYIGDVENIEGNGKIVIERRMFYPLRPDVKPPERVFGPPV